MPEVGHWAIRQIKKDPDANWAWGVHRWTGHNWEPDSWKEGYRFAGTKEQAQKEADRLNG